jgi:hypothetical protein
MLSFSCLLTQTFLVGRKVCVLAEELSVANAASPLWSTMRPLLNVALRLEQYDETYCWRGWNKRQIEAFLKTLPAHCSIVVAVWEMTSGNEVTEQEVLRIGWVAEVIDGEVSAIRTLDTFSGAGLPPVQQLEAGFEHGLEIMRIARTQIAPVAVALFTEKETWDEWLYAEGEHGEVIDKGALLMSLAQKGRCVLMGSQVNHHP